MERRHSGTSCQSGGGDIGDGRLGVAGFLAALVVLLHPGPAQASWWSKSVSKMDVRGITLGMSEDEVAKLHPELQLGRTTSALAGGRMVPLDPSLVESGLSDGHSSCATECFSVGFASSKLGGGVDYLYFVQTAPNGANIDDILADMEKKYGSPTDLRKNPDMGGGTSSITASWGLSIDASSPIGPPQSGQQLKVELEDDDGTVQVTIALKDFGVEAADEQLHKAYLAQAALQQGDQASKAVSY